MEDNLMSTNEKGTPQSRTYTVNDIAAILGIGRASAYKLANSGLFKTIRIGNMIRISRKSFEDWLKAEGLDDETDYVLKLPQAVSLRQFRPCLKNKSCTINQAMRS